MAKKKTEVPQYGTVMRKGIPYYRTRILDADGKQVSLYAATSVSYTHLDVYKRQVWGIHVWKYVYSSIQRYRTGREVRPRQQRPPKIACGGSGAHRRFLDVYKRQEYAPPVLCA